MLCSHYLTDFLDANVMAKLPTSSFPITEKWTLRGGVRGRQLSGPIRQDQWTSGPHRQQGYAGIAGGQTRGHNRSQEIRFNATKNISLICSYFRQKMHKKMAHTSVPLSLPSHGCYCLCPCLYPPMDATACAPVSTPYTPACAPVSTT